MRSKISESRQMRPLQNTPDTIDYTHEALHS